MVSSSITSECDTHRLRVTSDIDAGRGVLSIGGPAILSVHRACVELGSIENRAPHRPISDGVNGPQADGHRLL